MLLIMVLLEVLNQRHRHYTRLMIMTMITMMTLMMMIMRNHDYHVAGQWGAALGGDLQAL